MCNSSRYGSSITTIAILDSSSSLSSFASVNVFISVAEKRRSTDFDQINIRSRLHTDSHSHCVQPFNVEHPLICHATQAYNWNYLSESVGVCLKWCDFFKQKRERSQRKSKKIVWKRRQKKRYLFKEDFIRIHSNCFFLPLAKVIHVCICPSNCDALLLLLLRLLLLWLPNILRFWVNICFRFHWIHVRRRLMLLFLPLCSRFERTIAARQPSESGIVLSIQSDRGPSEIFMNRRKQHKL